MHTSLSGGFTYNGTHYTGDAANIAQGDNYLSILIPQIMASQAYQNNGAIILWNDESEGGDDLTRSIMEIVISPLAKGDAYASSAVTSHSSDIKTIEELYGLGTIDNPVPNSEPFAGGGFASVADANDLSDLFVGNSVPEPTGLSLLGLGAAAVLLRRRKPPLQAH